MAAKGPGVTNPADEGMGEQGSHQEPWGMHSLLGRALGAVLGVTEHLK